MVDLGFPSSSMKRLFNKMPPEGIVGDLEKKKKEVVVLSHKEVTQSASDVSTILEKVSMKDLLSVLKSDSRLAHKPLVYQL